MENLKKILDECIENGARDMWISDKTMNGLLQESATVRVEANLIMLDINGYQVVIASNVGKLYDMTNSNFCYYQLEAINGLYHRENNDSAVVL